MRAITPSVDKHVECHERLGGQWRLCLWRCTCKLGRMCIKVDRRRGATTKLVPNITSITQGAARVPFENVGSCPQAAEEQSGFLLQDYDEGRCLVGTPELLTVKTLAKCSPVPSWRSPRWRKICF